MPLVTPGVSLLSDVWAFAAAATPDPTPSGPPAELVTPGFAGFAVIAVIVIAVILLVWDMQRRIRRARYREEVGAELDAEQSALAASEVPPVAPADTVVDEPRRSDEPRRADEPLRSDDPDAPRG